GATFACLDPSAVRLARDVATWRVVGPNDCTEMVVDTDTSLPSDARPIDLAGVPGLYGTSDAKTDVRTIYSRNPDGGWSALTVAPGTSDQSLRGFYVPSG